MIQTRFRGILIILSIVIMVVTIPIETMAKTPYEGYIWNTERRDVRSIIGYQYDRSIDGAFLPTGPFVDPEDIFIADDDSIYLVDSGNNRVIMMDKNGNVVTVYGDSEGPGKLNGPKGVYVTEDELVYVADTKNQRIVQFDKKGEVIKELAAPNSPLLGAKFSYSPSKLVVDKRNYLYVVSEGNTQGLMQIDPNGEFKGFYGANEVGFSWKRLFTKLIATDEQKAKLASVKPLAFSNLTQDRDGFIYTTTLGTDDNQIKRLSPVGVDTLNQGVKQYGDIRNYGAYIDVSAFVDLTVDENGLITVLNLQTSKIYQYDKLGNLLFIFGGNGDQNGVFTTPVSIDVNSQGIIYVVDKGRNRIDLFRTTPFADLVHEASRLYVDGKYEEAKSIWEQVIRINGNYDIAYLAIGKALYKNEQYREAMDYFKVANSRADYSQAFREYRVQFTRDNFSWIFGGIIFLFIFIKFIFPIIRKWLKQNKRLQFRKSSVEGKGEL